MVRAFLRFLLATSFSLFFATSAFAAVVTWDGEGGDGLWNTGTNWSTGSVPTSLDIATFDATNTGNISLNITTTVAGVDINSGYTGTITMASGVTLNVLGSNFDIAAGTFTGVSNAVLDTDSDIVISGGTFNAPGNINVKDDWTHTVGGTFNHLNGTVTFNENLDGVLDFAAAVSTSGVFYNVLVSKSTVWLVQINTGDTLAVGGNLTLTDGRFNSVTGNSGVVDIKGNLVVGANIDGTTTNVQFSDTDAQSIDLTGATALFDGSITVNKGGGTFTFLSDITLNNSGQDFTLTAGTVDPGTYTLAVADIFSQAGGIYTGTGTLDCNLDFTLSGGTFNVPPTFTVQDDFTHTVGGTFAHNNRTITFDGDSDTLIEIDPAVSTSGVFYGLIMNKTSNWMVQVNTDDIIIIENTLTLTDGRLQTLGTTGYIEARGNVTGSSNLDTSTARLQFKSNANQNFDLSGAGNYDGNITINKTGGTVTALSNLTFDSGGQDFTLTAGTFDANGKAIIVADQFSQAAGAYTAGVNGSLDIDNDFILSGGVFNAPTNMYIFDDWTHTVGGTFNHQNGTVTFTDASDTTIDLAAISTSGLFYNVILNKSSNWLVRVNTGDSATSEGTLTLTEGRFNSITDGNGLWIAKGDVIVASTIDGTETDLTFSGTAVQTFTLTGAEGAYNNDIIVDKSGGRLDLGSTLTMDASNQDLTIVEGTCDLNGNNLTVSGAATEKIVVETGGNLQLQGGEMITADSASYPQLDTGSTVTYDGIVGPYTLKDYTYKNLTINGAGAVFNAAANEVLGGNLTVTAGTLDVNDLTLAINGNTVINGGTMKSGTNTVTFGDAGADSVTISSGGLEIESDAPGVDIVKNATSWTNSGGTVTYNAATGIVGVVLSGLSPYYNLTINSSGSTYSLQALTDVDSSVTLTAGTLDVSGSNYNMAVGGSWTDTGAAVFTEGTGTVTFDGTGTLNSNEAFNNVTLNSAGTVTLGAALDVDGNLTISAGALDVSGTNYGITVGGNWAKSGTFTQRSGTVTFDTAGTTSTISGNTIFYNLSCITANKPLAFTAGSTQTISGALTLAGTAGNLILLRSTVTDSAWNLNVAGTSSVAYVDAKDSNAAGGSAIMPTNSTNSLGNANWTFNRAPTVASVTGVQAATGTANVTISFIMDDPDDDNTLQAKVEYSLDGGSTWNDPTLSTAGADTSAVQGDPSVNNAVTYQVGQSGAFILSSGGANTVTTVWVGATDLLTTVNIANARIRITPYDGTVEGTAGSSSNFILDRVAPSGLANFNHGDFASDRAALSWTAATDTNFNHYEIWSGETESQVIARSGSAVEWDNDNDATLTTASTTTTTINNTDPRNKFFKIFAVDNYGNELTLATVYVSGGQSSASSFSSSGGGGGGGSSGSSSSSDSSDDDTTEQEESEDEETTGSSSGEDSDAESDGDSEEEEEPVVEVEEETPAETTWEEMGIEPPDHWSQGYVKYLQEQNNIIQVAVTEPTFMDILLGVFTTPDAMLDRARALEFLIVIAGYDIQVVDLNTRTMAFTDVPADHDRAAFIQFGFEQGLINGYPDGTFQPEMTINRVEALKMATYFFEGDWTHPVYGDELLELYDLEKNPFSDVDLNAWYAPYLINAYAKGVIHGYGDGTFGPGNYVTYAEFLKIATLMKNVEEAVELAEELQ